MDGSFAQGLETAALDPRVVLDDVVRAADGFGLSSLFTGSMAGSGSWTDYFVHDTGAVAAQIEELATRLQPLSDFDLCLTAVHPAPLAGMRDAHRVDWGALKRGGIDHVLRLEEGDSYDVAPLLVRDAFQGPHGETIHSDEAEEKIVRAAAGFVAERILEGEGVLVLSREGNGRAETVLALTLIELGIPREEAAQRLERLGWPVNASGMNERVWRPYVNPFWVTQPEECFISDDEEFILSKPYEDEEVWVVTRRRVGWPEEDLEDGLEEYEYYGEAPTKEEAIALLPHRNRVDESARETTSDQQRIE